jgi:iron complex transport system substrate-binding protein
MRVVSLLPAATEIVAALGGTGLLVGISHECDFPPQVGALPRVTSTQLDSRLASREIDAQMALAKRTGHATVDVDVATLARLRPDVLIGQSLCDVCAVSGPALERVVTSLQPTPWVVTLHPHTLADALVDIWRVGEAIGLPEEAEEVVAGLKYRLRRVQESHVSRPTPPRVVVLEWLDPPYVAGHWVPELVALAGGEDVGNAPGIASVARSWGELAALAPDLVVVALCGFDVARARQELAQVVDDDARAVLARRVEFLDGNAYTSRPGPRLVDAAEQLAALMRG